MKKIHFTPIPQFFLQMTNQAWVADIMIYTLTGGKIFYAFITTDVFSRKILSLEMYELPTGHRPIHIFKQFRQVRGSPEELKCDNSHMFQSVDLVARINSADIFIRHIQPRKPYQNVTDIKRFKHSYPKRC